MDWPRRSAPVLQLALLAILVAPASGCDPAEQFPNSEELEAQLRADPGRSGRGGQFVGLVVSQQAHRLAGAMSTRLDPACAGPVHADERWVAELTLERRRGTSVQSSWTETRTLDRGPDSVAMRYAARFQTEIGTHGSRGAEWRVMPSGTFIATQTDAGDRWYRRPTEEDEAGRILAIADGMLQSLLDAGGGWQRAGAGWALGDAPLRCGRSEPRAAFLSRLGAGATATKGAFTIAERTRRLEATWQLSDSSTIVATYTDRVVPLPEPLEEPAEQLIIPITRERSLYRSERLLSKLAEDGLATVASAPAPPAMVSGDDEQAKSK